ncbi:hypothetical protein ACFLSJ_06835 [Verrucomicrobiota bacterium]
MKMISPVVRSARFSALVITILAAAIGVRAADRLEESPVRVGDFGSIEYKLLLDLDGLSAEEPIEATLRRMGEQLDMMKVGASAKHRLTAYVDTADRRLAGANYILRVRGGRPSPASARVTLKGRWSSVERAVRLSGPGLRPSKHEIDVTGGRKVYSISYSVRLGGSECFPDGEMTGESLLKAIKKPNPAPGAHLESIIKDAELVVRPSADHYSSWAKLKPGQVASAGEGGVDLDVDIMYFGTDRVVVELSYTRNAAAEKEAAALYRELMELLEKRGVLAKRQSTKTAAYLDHHYPSQTP